MFTKYIIEWYESYGRDLPWRQTKDPYKIWISEIILQQTRVLQGYEYYLRFIDRFPNVKVLSEASEMEVLKYWQGLGYYSRARNLHTAAQSIKGEFPSTYKDVIALKGVGEYTAAAICSFAFDLPYAVVDGNVYRVLSRYYGIDTAIDSSEGKKEFAALAQELLDKKHPAKYNQAIMDFGALQCTPKQPKCLDCPLSSSCVAYNNQLIDILPYKKGKVKVRERFFNYFYIVEEGKFIYLHKREENDIWKSLYEFPLIETDKKTDLSEILVSNNFLKSLNIADIKTITIDFKHILSHQRLFTNIYKLEVSKKCNLSNDYLKIQEEDLDLYPIPRLLHQFLPKILE